MIDINKIKEYAQKCYDDANCQYNGENYFVHINMVVNVLNRYKYIFNTNTCDFENTHAAAYLHDCGEDARLTFNNIKDISNKEVAKIVLAVTDVPEENRLLRHLCTMHKTVKDYRAIILKLCDIHANASYSKETGSSMYKKYVIEYQYRKPIFQLALNWYPADVCYPLVKELWKELDEIHNINNKKL
jgi:(p)ppGpp synthase/HD superfamily hydrolase